MATAKHSFASMEQVIQVSVASSVDRGTAAQDGKAQPETEQTTFGQGGKHRKAPIAWNHGAQYMQSF